MSILDTELSGDWLKAVLPRTKWKREMTEAELRARFQGGYKKKKRTCKLSPKQAAKWRWRRKRRAKAALLLAYRESRGVFYLLMRRMEHDERYGKTTNMKFEWYEREPLPGAGKPA